MKNENIILLESSIRLAKEYLSKVSVCDECFCEYWCIEQDTKLGRKPYRGCERNIINYLAQIFRD